VDATDLLQRMFWADLADRLSLEQVMHGASVDYTRGQSSRTEWKSNGSVVTKRSIFFW